MIDKYVALIQYSPPDGTYQVWGNITAGDLGSRIATIVEFAHSRDSKDGFGWAIAKVETSGLVRGK